jgi:hypothetical protein
MAVTLPGGGGAHALIGQTTTGRLFAFEHGAWVMPAAQRPPSGSQGNEVSDALQALADDGQGGVWVAARGARPNNWGSAASDVYLYRYTDNPRRDVFSEVPNPFGGGSLRVTSLAGVADGSIWAGANSANMFHYDRLVGWEQIPVQGWDPGLTTAPSEVNAVAVTPDGTGVAVGKGGRIADLTGASATLDAAAGKLCVDGPPPCGSSRDLRAVSVAPDGSAIAGGDHLTLLWRPAGGTFHTIAPPSAPATSQITGVSLPRPDTAFVTTDRGAVFAGRLTDAGSWSWTLEDVNDHGEVLANGRFGKSTALHAVAVDATGHGFAVGDRGLVLERSPSGSASTR